MPDTDTGPRTAPEPPVSPTEPQTGPPGTSGPTGTQGTGEGRQSVSDDEKALLSREAANWRTKLREAEEREGRLQARLDASDRAEVERLVAPRLIDASDFTIDLSELRDDAGQIDPAKVDAALTALVAAKPHFAASLPRYDFDAGVRRSPVQPPSFGEALKAATRSSST